MVKSLINIFSKIELKLRFKVPVGMSCNVERNDDVTEEDAREEQSHFFITQSNLFDIQQ